MHCAFWETMVCRHRQCRTFSDQPYLRSSCTVRQRGKASVQQLIVKDWMRSCQDDLSNITDLLADADEQLFSSIMAICQSTRRHVIITTTLGRESIAKNLSLKLAHSTTETLYTSNYIHIHRYIHRTSMVIAWRFVLTNASRAKSCQISMKNTLGTCSDTFKTHLSTYITSFLSDNDVFCLTSVRQICGPAHH